MEQSEGYKNVQQRIRILEQILSKCGEAVQECEKSGEEAVKEIEDQFTKCVNALAERKTVLLMEVQAKMINQKQKLGQSESKLKTSIEVCKQIIATSSLMYSLNEDSTAESIFQKLTKLDVPKVSSIKVKAQLPGSLLTTIQNYGNVVDTSCPSSTANNSVCFANADVVTTFVGSSEGNQDGKGIHAKFNYPWGICFNPLDDCMFVCDYNNNSIKKLSMQGNVSTFVQGSGLGGPIGIVFNSKENAFFVTNHVAHSISKINTSGAVSVLAGSGQPGKADGVGGNASFYNPIGITIDPATGVLFVCDFENQLIRKISRQGRVTTLAGTGVAGYVDGDKDKALFNKPYGLCFCEDEQALFVCDLGNNKLRKVLLNGSVSTMCDVAWPTDVIITTNKNIIVTSLSNRLFKVTLQDAQKYVAEVIAGTGSTGRVDGKANECTFNQPYGIAVHETSHSCFVTESGNNTIRKVSFVNN